jgi:hypothetical protein
VTRFLVALVEDRRLAAATLGALAIVGGSAAPWSHVPLGPVEFTELGLEADGKVTIVLGALALVLLGAYAFLRQRDLAGGAALAALVVAGLAAAYEVNVRRASGRVGARIAAVDPGAVTSQFAARTGVGLWICLAGATLLAGAALSIVAGRGRLGRSGGLDSPAVAGDLKR